jgi:ABC-type nitrate/sulfonate/bicarbonate transport system permease component
MANWRIDRGTVFLSVVLLLFVWDLGYFLGLRNPDRLPHPFVFFGMLGDFEFLRGFGRVVLRHTIFSSVLGGVLGVGLGILVARSTRLTQVVLDYLRHGLWFPVFVLFATPDPFTLSIAAVALCACYHYLTSVSLLRLRGHEVRMYVAREVVLQGFLFSLLSQIWWRGWNWFEFAAVYQPAKGAGVLVTLLVFVGLINWIFHFDFDVNAARQRTILDQAMRSTAGISVFAFIVFTVVLLIIWQAVGWLRFPFWSSPAGVVNAGYHLFASDKIHQDIGLSLSELLAGVVLGLIGASLLAVLASAANGITRGALFAVLPFLYIAPIALWLLTWLIPPLTTTVGSF